MTEIFPISDFVRNASENTARIRLTKRAEILTQHGRPSLAVMPAEEFERLIAASEFMDGRPMNPEANASKFHLRNLRVFGGTRIVNTSQSGTVGHSLSA